MYRNVYQIFNYDINKQHIKLIKTLFTSVKLCKKKQFNNWSDNKINEYNVLYVEKVLSQIDTNVDKVLKPLRDCVKKQEGVIRALQRINANQLDVNNAVNELNCRKQLLKAKQLELTPINACINRLKLETVLKKRFFFDHSYNIYAPISGIYDYGPVGCALKNNIIDVWRKHFILEEQMLEVDCTVLTPEPVLKASGHVERFADLMVKDVTTGECFRLDHLIKAFLEKLMHDKKCTESLKQEYEDVITKLDGYSKQQMNEVLRKYQIKSPISGNELTDAIEFNLMFSTSIGSGSDSFKAYLRPETAQGIFINFKRLLEFNHKKLPFAAAQIGNAFRNEITPRSGLIRVREFTLAEIEHFVDPSNKLHPKYDSIKNESLILYSACNQMDGISAKNVIIEEAVNNGTIANQTLAYFLARIHSFLIKIGIDSQRLRFRQHMGNEMAHYATDCWDAECLTSYGWVECVGCADRSCYDLLQHSKATGVKLNAERKLSEPKQVDVVECIPQKELIDKIFISDSNLIYKALNCLENSQLVKYKTELLKYGYFTITIENKEFRITKDMLTLITVNKSVFVEEITPEVIEPSFGIGRILYTVLDHNYKIRDKDENRTYFSLPVLIAPYKCAILPLSKQTRLKDFIKKISVVLTDSNISHKIDDSTGSIGKRYTRLDEIAIPFGITIDFDTINTNTATLRERDSMQQIRAPIEVLGSLVNELTNGKLTWNEAKAIYPLFLKQESADQNC